MLTAPTLLSNTRVWLSSKLRAYLSLVKYLQTGLLVITGLAGYMSARPTNPTWQIVAGLLGSMFLTVGGSTVVNMVIDRDIDCICSAQLNALSQQKQSSLKKVFFLVWR